MREMEKYKQQRKLFNMAIYEQNINMEYKNKNT